MAVCSARCLPGAGDREGALTYLRPAPTRGFSLTSLGQLPRRISWTGVRGGVIALSLAAILYMLFHMYTQVNSDGTERSFESFPKVRPGAPLQVPLVQHKLSEEKNDTRSDESYRDESLKVLGKLLETPCSTLWEIEGVVILARHGHTRALKKLKSFLADDESPRRRKAAYALASLGDKEALFLLRDSMRSPRTSVSAAAAFSLGRLGDTYALRYLKQLMKFKQTRFSAAESALHLNLAPARDYLYGLATKGKRPGDRVRAAYALARAGDNRVTPILMKALNDGTARYMAALGLAALGKREAIPVLNQAVKHISLRIEAARELAHLGDYDSLKSLHASMGSGFEPQRLTAASAIYILASRKLSSDNKTADSDMTTNGVLLTSARWMEQWLKL